MITGFTGNGLIINENNDEVVAHPLTSVFVIRYPPVLFIVMDFANAPAITTPSFVQL